MKIYGERLKKAIKDRGLKAKVVCKEIGVNEVNMSLYCTGKRNPEAAKMIEISDYMHLSLDYLYGLTDINICLSNLTEAQQNALIEIYEGWLAYNRENGLKVDSLGRTHEHLYKNDPKDLSDED